jgi:hypothetical protein
MTKWNPALVWANTTKLFDRLDSSIPTLKGAWQDLAAAFRRSVFSVVQNSELPFRLLADAAARLRLQRLWFLEQERLGKKSSELTKADFEAITTRARTQFAGAVGSTPEMRATAMWALAELGSNQADSEYNYARDDVLRQCFVMTWNSLEILARDGFESLIRRDPRCLVRLCKTEFARKRIGNANCRQIIAGEPRDPEWVVDRLNFSNLATIRQSYCESLEKATNDELARLLDPSNRSIDLIYERRHLIVHRRGVVDDKYVEKTGDALAIGSELVISGDDLGRTLAVIIDTGLAILHALNRTA